MYGLVVLSAVLMVSAFCTYRPVNTPELNPRVRRSGGATIDNSIIRIMHEAVKHLNKTNCWMCMHVPSSAKGPVVAAVPLSHNACEDPTNAAALREYYIKAPSIPNLIEKVAREHTPKGFNLTRIVGMTIISKTTGNYGDLLTVKSVHAQIDCGDNGSGALCDCPASGGSCDRLHSIPRVECSTVLTLSRSASPTLRAVQCTEARCETPRFIFDPTVTARSQVQFTITELYNVTSCINISHVNPGRPEVSLGNSNCIGPVHNIALDASKVASLPTGVSLACGGRIYSYVPYGGKGICYFAYAVPMIRVVTPEEIQVLDGHHTIHKRDLRRFFGMIIPGYGVYLSQQETKALSLALQAHINSTDSVVTAISTQLEEVTKVALQNRMALDLILASTGGVCKIIGTECCSYVHSANLSVENFHKANNKAMNDLHHITSWDMESVFGSWFSGGYTSLVRNVIMLFVALLIIVIILTVIVWFVKTCVIKLTAITAAQFVMVEPMTIIEGND